MSTTTHLLPSTPVFVGDEIRVTGTFTDDAGTAIDPDTVTFKQKDPSENTATLVYDTDVEVVKSATGVYYVDITLDEAGRWYFRWESTARRAAEESYVNVENTIF